MGYHTNQDCTAVTKHYIMNVMFFAKFFFFILLSLLFYYIWVEFKETLWPDFIKYLIFPLVFFFFNYGFLKLILGFIEYYNYLFIIKNDQIIIINCSFILKDDIEVIDSLKVIKVDSFSRGLVANLLSYGTIVIELQSREVRSFRFMPDPFRLLKKIQEQKVSILQRRGKKVLSDKEEYMNVKE